MTGESRKNFVFITGGARSGKSGFAEECARHFEKVLYYATAQLFDEDSEFQKKIEKHRRQRPSKWHTVEGSLDHFLAAANSIQPDAVLVDCATLWLSSQLITQNGFFDGAWTEQNEKALEEECLRFLEVLKGLPCVCLVVSNEVGSGIVPETPSGRLFRNLLGEWNMRLMKEAWLGVHCVAGRALLIKNSYEEERLGYTPMHSLGANHLVRILATGI